MRRRERSELAWLRLLVLAASLGISGASKAAPTPDKPFAEHHIVLQLSDGDPKKESLIISIAFKLLEVYGPDKVAIEVVAFGPGIDLLKRDNANRQLVDSLV